MNRNKKIEIKEKIEELDLSPRAYRFYCYLLFHANEDKVVEKTVREMIVETCFWTDAINKFKKELSEKKVIQIYRKKNSNRNLIKILI